MVKVGDYVRIIGENIEGVVHKVNSKPCEHLVGKYGRICPAQLSVTRLGWN